MIHINKTAMKALDGSISKWKDIVKGIRINGGTTDCPLCQKYNTVGNDECVKMCLVGITTAQPFCVGTPYNDYYYSHTKEHAEAMLKCLIDIKANCVVEVGIRTHWKD